MYAVHKPPELKLGATAGRESWGVPQMSSSTSEACDRSPERAKGLCSGSRAARIPRSHHKPNEIPPISTAKRLEADVTEGELASSVDKFVSVQEPCDLQATGVWHPAPAGPAEPEVLQ